MWTILAGAVFAVGFFISAPYGRHFHGKGFPSVDDRVGWAIMEAPAVLVFGFCFLSGVNFHTLPAVIFFVLWESHYVYRSFIYVFMRGNNKRRMALLIMVLGIAFNLINSCLNGLEIFTISPDYPYEWLYDPRFIVGLAVFLIGCTINRWADYILARLRSPSQSGYRIPHDGLYEWISCPNYLGEIIQWLGWALATWSWAGLAFALWTAANLIPRARAHHLWYQDHFPNYPTRRKILAPGIW
jgi:3-oxo-5-alpha-steroid 4-dehydrogenase 1